MNKNRGVIILMLTLSSLLAFTIVPTYATLTYLWNSDPEISGHSELHYEKNYVEEYFAPWGPSTWGFRAFTWQGSTHGKIDKAAVAYNPSYASIVYMYGYQGYTNPPWVGVVSMTQGHIKDQKPGTEVWYKPPALRTYGKQMQIEIKYKEGKYGDNYNWAWNLGSARILINVWFEDRTRGSYLVLDICLDERLGWGAIGGQNYGSNYFAYVSSSEKTSLGNNWYSVNLDLDSWLSKAIAFNNYYYRKNYDSTNMWLNGTEFVLELYNAKREAWIDYYYLSYT